MRFHSIRLANALEHMVRAKALSSLLLQAYDSVSGKVVDFIDKARSNVIFLLYAALSLIHFVAGTAESIMSGR